MGQRLSWLLVDGVLFGIWVLRLLLSDSSCISLIALLVVVVVMVSLTFIRRLDIIIIA